MTGASQLDYCQEQKITCSCCGSCCNNLEVIVTCAEKLAIEKFRFKPEIKLDGAFLPRPHYFWALSKTPQGKCVFLNEKGLCRIHIEGGTALKPLACRLYPFVVHVWADNHISADCRYYCPAVSAACGKPVTEQEEHLSVMAELLKKLEKPVTVPYSRDNPAGLAQVRQVNAAFRLILENECMPLGLRLYIAARVLDFHARRDMRAAIASADAEFVADALEFVAKAEDNLRDELRRASLPNLDDRTRFRLAISGFYRDDAPHPSLMYRIRRAKHMYRWTTGGGSLHELNPTCPDTTGIDCFSIRRATAFAPEAIRELEVFLWSKLDSMHHCGPAALHFNWEDGTRHLLLSALGIVAGAGIMAGALGRTQVDGSLMRQTLSYADTTFRLSPFFRTRHYRVVAAKLCQPQRFAKLVKTFLGEI